jgi:YggT family protein
MFLPTTLYQIISFLLDVAVGLVGGACLLRLYMQHQRVPFNNPVGQFVFALTDWVVLPLRKLIPVMGKWDVVCVLAAYLLVLAQYALLWSLSGFAWTVVLVPLMAVFGLLRLVISGLTGLLIVYAVLSWVQTDSPLTGVLERLCAPLLQPLRKLIPLVGGVDLSALVAIVLLQVASMLLGSMQTNLLRF